MKRNFYVFMALFFFASCSNETKTQNGVNVPGAPKDLGTVKTTLVGKNYEMNQAGVLSPFKMDADNPIEWFSTEKDTSRFFKDFLDDVMKTSFAFSNDSVVNFVSGKTSATGKWKLDEEQGEDEKPGIKLRITYEDTTGSFGFGNSTEPMEMTFTYLVSGLGENSLLLELPREYNRRKVVALLNKK